MSVIRMQNGKSKRIAAHLMNNRYVRKCGMKHTTVLVQHVNRQLWRLPILAEYTTQLLVVQIVCYSYYLPQKHEKSMVMNGRPNQRNQCLLDQPQTYIPTTCMMPPLDLFPPTALTINHSPLFVHHSVLIDTQIAKEASTCCFLSSIICTSLRGSSYSHCMMIHINTSVMFK